MWVIIAIVLFVIYAIVPWPQIVVDEETETVWWAKIIRSIFQWLAVVVALGTIATHIVLNTAIYSRITYGKN